MKNLICILAFMLAPLILFGKNINKSEVVLKEKRSNTVLLSYDYGKNWYQEKEQISTTDYTAIEKRNDNNIIITYDGGHTWHRINMTEEENYNEYEVVTYPTPVLDELNVIIDEKFFDDISKVDYTIIDLTGKDIMSGSLISQTNLRLQLNNLNTGMYILKLNNSKHTIITKILKE